MELVAGWARARWPVAAEAGRLEREPARAQIQRKKFANACDTITRGEYPRMGLPPKNIDRIYPVEDFDLTQKLLELP